MLHKGRGKSQVSLAADPKPALRSADRSASTPLWSQVKSALVEMIVNEPLAEHARLPSEAELCNRFGVSRTVVREALNQLVFERAIYKLQGKGAFVAGRRDDQDFLNSNVGFSGEWHERHRAVSRRIIRQELEQADPRARHLLRLSSDLTVIAIDRVMSVDGLPRILVHTKVVAALAPALESVSLENRSLYDTLFRAYGIKMTRAERWLAAVCATPEQAALLGVADNTPLISIESIGFSGRDEPVEYYTAFYRTDRGRLHFSVS
ncbi:MAG: GntR family transcriptional regulator [Tardiphaga sp.]|nr:GntR family transcriptional regulator [Tardiphaga sp.]MDB5625462.1 GntR family transcriptional regulator [Tardiphaga sp.]MDB5630700.1 GntR family transcriptional regulator [Tardiphaga sp.]